MKKILFATMMCLAAMSAQAQVLTSSVVNHVYEQLSTKAESDFAYNAEMEGDVITTLYVYRKSCGRKGNVSLTPSLKYDYQYAADGLLTARVVSAWNSWQDCWQPVARYDYTLAHGRYCAEFSRYNQEDGRFGQPTDRMVYSMLSADSVSYVSCYQRDRAFAPFHLTGKVEISNLPMLFAGK